jgi:predicted HTH transcriptional regulator
MVKGINSEALAIDPAQIKWLTALVREGEGLHLEFKLRATFPDKIVHELIAFANTSGGTLLIGVDDDGRLAGVKYPEEESLLVMRALIKHAHPRIRVNYFYVRLTSKRWVVVFEVPEAKRKPVKFLVGRNTLLYFIRYQDKSLQASREAEGIMRLRSGKKAVAFTYGDIENKILKTLEQKGSMSLADLCLYTSIAESQLSPHLIKLAATRVIGWKPGESHDLFFPLQSKV